MEGVDLIEEDRTNKRWAVFVHKHVVPLGDLMEHELCTSCPCGPREEEQSNASVIVVHHAFDQREGNE